MVVEVLETTVAVSSFLPSSAYSTLPSRASGSTVVEALETTIANSIALDRVSGVLEDTVFPGITVT